MIQQPRNGFANYHAPGSRAAEASRIEAPFGLCNSCGVPFDSQYFDASGVFDAPLIGQSVPLAEVNLPPQYCGVLEYFAQFTDEHANNPAAIRTDGIEWIILVDGSPLFPYLRLDRIVNPWGEGAASIAIRLPEGATIRFIARGVATRNGNPSGINEVGGRLVGRYWYNVADGDAGRTRS